MSSVTARAAFIAAVLPLLALAVPVTSEAQGSNYAAEVEPHLVVQWDREPWCNDDGLGLGVRGSFPVYRGGPIPNIDNSIAIGVGLDLAFFDGDCVLWTRFRDQYDATSLWVPVNAQWNIFFNERWSALLELGLGLEHVSAEACAGRVCEGYDDTDVHPVLWLGGRFMVTPEMAITMRLGTPSFLLGMSFFL